MAQGRGLCVLCRLTWRRARTSAAPPARSLPHCSIGPPAGAAHRCCPQEVISEITDTSELGQRGEVWFAAQVVSLGLVFLGPPGFLRPLVDVAGWAAIAAGVGLLFAGQQVGGEGGAIAAGLLLALGVERCLSPLAQAALPLFFWPLSRRRWAPT